ncbi:ABC transporter substrate-binding protein [Patescibacteria group bacterium]
MTTKSKIILVIVIVLAIVLVGYSFAQVSDQDKGEKQTIKIGVILPLTGGQANLGQSAKNAVLLAREEFGDTRFDYEVIIEDDALDTKMTSNAVNKLVNIDKVDALISFTSGSGNVVSPVAQENKKIHIGVASDPAIANGEYNFLHWTTPAAEVEKLVEEFKKRGIKTISVLGMNQQGQIAVIEDLKDQISGSDIKVIQEQVFNMGNRDYKVMIEKARQGNPDIIFVGAFSPDIEILAKQYKELGVEIPLTCVEAFEYTEQPELFEGYWYVQSAEASDSFANDFAGKFFDKPKLGSPFVYDAINLIVEAYEQTGQVDNVKAIENLNKIKDFPSAVGEISVGDEGIVWSDAVVREIRDGQPVTIE